MNDLSAPIITSPCTGICKLDEATGWCLGCARSGDEIAVWRSGDAAWRAAVWDKIPDRLAQLGVACRRLDWTTEATRQFVVDSARRGTWTMGVEGAVAEFSPLGDVDVDVLGDVVTMRTGNGALRMRIDDAMRAVTFDPPGTPEDQMRVVLAVKRDRGRLDVYDGVADLGADAAALLPEVGRLFDLGLGRKEARFAVRVTDPALKDTLTAAQGLSLMDALPLIAGPLFTHSPTRVVETGLGRIEVQGPIPGPTERSPDGPHTHLLPDRLAQNRAMPVGMDLPPAYLPGAIFFPIAPARLKAANSTAATHTMDGPAGVSKM